MPEDAGQVWVFGYGSLIWRPDFAFIEAAPARLKGYSRRFWQGSHDHRGTPYRPGRVVTLIPDVQHHCDGVAYLLDAETVAATFEALDYREKNGYQRNAIRLELHDGRNVTGRVYIAPPDNDAFLGEAHPRDIARQIVQSVGPSGRNLDYLLQLAQALRELQADDSHVFELESLALELVR